MMSGAPIKKKADWFKHDNDMRNDPKIRAIRTKFGLEGYAIYCMILETLTDSDHFTHPFTAIDKELLAGDFGISMELLSAITTYSSSVLNLFELKNGTISCPKLIERFDPLLTKRKRDRKKVIANDNKQSNSIIADDKTIIADDKGTEESRVDKRRKENIINNTNSKVLTDINSNAEPQKPYVENLSEVVNLFIKRFQEDYSIKFSPTNKTAFTNSILLYKTQIENEYASVLIFLKTVLRRMQDYQNIKTPLNYFMTGCFGQDKYLWRLTADEEKAGSGYHKKMMDDFIKKHGVKA